MVVQLQVAKFVANDEKHGLIDELIAHIRASLFKIFPLMPVKIFEKVADAQNEFAKDKYLGDVMRYAVSPASRLYDAANKYYPKIDFKTTVHHGPCGGYLNAYTSLCDFHGQIPREEISWVIDNVWHPMATDQMWHSKAPREFDFSKFADFKPKELIPVVDALSFNPWFNKVVARGTKMNSRLASIFLSMIRRNHRLYSIVMEKNSTNFNFMQNFADAIARSSSEEGSKLVEVDISRNIIEERALTKLAEALGKLENGLSYLRLSNCGLNKRAGQIIVSNLQKIGDENSASRLPISESLTFLDLSKNNIGADGLLAISELLASPNRIETCDLSSASMPNIEVLFGALVRGSCKSLKVLNLSDNRFGIDEDKSGSSFEKFFRNTQALTEVDLSSTQIPPQFLSGLFSSLLKNNNLSGLSLKLNSNGFGFNEGTVIGKCIKSMRCLAALELDGNRFDGELGLVPLFEGLKFQSSLESLSLSKCLNDSNLSLDCKFVHQDAGNLDLNDLLTLPNLSFLSLAGNNLRESLWPLLESIQQSFGKSFALSHLNISGNSLGDQGAVKVANLIMNSNIKDLVVDNNSLSLTGWQVILSATEKSPVVENVAMPRDELSRLKKSDYNRAKRLADELKTVLVKHSNESTSPTSPRSPTSGGQQISDQALTLGQQESLNRAVSKLKNNVSVLKEASSKGDKSAEKHLKVANQVLSEVVSHSDLLDQIVSIIESLSSERSQGLRNQVGGLSIRLFEQLKKTRANMVDSVIKRVSDKMPNVLNSQGGPSADLKSYIGDSDEDVLNEAFISNIIETNLLQELERRSFADTSSLISTIKRILVERMISAINGINRQLNPWEKNEADVKEVVLEEKSPQKSLVVSSEADLNSFAAESSTLVHITKDRIKPPTRRPPSRLFAAGEEPVIEDIPSPPSGDSIPDEPEAQTNNPEAQVTVTEESTAPELKESKSQSRSFNSLFKKPGNKSSNTLKAEDKKKSVRNSITEFLVAKIKKQRTYKSSTSLAAESNDDFSDVEPENAQKIDKQTSEPVQQEIKQGESPEPSKQSSIKAEQETSSEIMASKSSLVSEKESESEEVKPVPKRVLDPKTRASTIGVKLPYAGESPSLSSKTFQRLSRRISNETPEDASFLSLGRKSSLSKDGKSSSSGMTKSPSKDTAQEFLKNDKGAVVPPILRKKETDGSVNYEDKAHLDPESPQVADGPKSLNRKSSLKERMEVKKRFSSAHLDGTSDFTEKKKEYISWIKKQVAENTIDVNSSSDDILDYVKDGVSILQIIKAIAEEKSGAVPKYKTQPKMRVHKIDNLNIFLKYLRDNAGLNVHNVTAEELVMGEPKKVMILFNGLIKAYP